MSVSAKAGPWLELIPLDAVTVAAMRHKADIPTELIHVRFWG